MGFISNKKNYKIWIFAPFLQTEDPTLSYYYDFTQSIAEYTKAFDDIGCEWEWMDVTVQNLDEQVSRVKNYSLKKSVVLNLCDGDDVNGVPGISVVQALEDSDLVFTGSEACFYNLTTSKLTMKKAFDRHRIPTPQWVCLDEETVDTVFASVGRPLIVKPAVSAGSMGISLKNVVSNDLELREIMQAMTDGYKGWKLDEGGLVAERFIAGREFTCLLVGSHTMPGQIRFYTPVERVFNKSLPETEQILSFDRLWEVYEQEAPLPGDEGLYHYAAVNSQTLLRALRKLSLQAFLSVKGTGYARLDIRQDASTGKLYVLEINAQCGLSEDENYTSIGAILRFGRTSFSGLIVQIVEDAVLRHKVKIRI